MQVVILSPHRDDAAFSCGLLLARLLQAGHSLCIANVCTISSYAPYLAVGEGDRAQQVTKARREEDVRFADRLVTGANSASSVRRIDLDWQDLPLRWQKDDSASLAPSSLRPREVEALEEALRGLPSADIILCPKALGGHLDHRLVCRAAQRVFQASSMVFYEDLPYACGKLAKSSSELGDLDGFEEVWLGTKNVEPRLKRDLCLSYPSQIDEAAAAAMEHYGQLHGGERFLALPGTLQRLRSALAGVGVVA
ncbi:N-acetylglucosaminyl deacetylase, LmbE family [Terriglobus roseus]|uniref:N-acetylglucosaminyl deacetylase, LmbE family n=2 Tax=Terriglobus roseus TaxID=392734 RepID=A0A1H4JZJ0_9BACT|nr:PIG-L family deacetylase [Terriglobus roseus]SEB51714.1 N-acetylglucosaminyl deacetylase, LmbE family [Terriglobus roseus]